MGEVKLDYIVQELTEEQRFKVAEFQSKVALIQNLPSFDDEVLHDPKHQRLQNSLIEDDSSQFQWDVSVIGTKSFAKSIGSLTPAELKEMMWKDSKHDDPDALIVRHLEARDWNVDTALCMTLNSVRWRTELKVFDGLLAGGDLAIRETAENGSGEEQQISKEVMAQLRSGKSFTNGIDRKGRPLLFTRVQKHIPSAQSLKSLERYTIFQSESARMLLRPPTTTVGIIFDLGGFSMANMDWNAIRLMTAGMEDKYPESTGAVYVYRAPWIIGGIWSVVKTWMPGKEAQKVTFVRDAKALSEYVDLKYLPPDMGGTGDFEYRYVEPVAGENDIMKDTVKRDEILAERQRLVAEYEERTIEWFDLLQLERIRDEIDDSGDGDNKMIAAIDQAIAKTRSKSANQALIEKRQVMTKIRDNYFELDPYVRGRCHGDRAGIKPIDTYQTES